MNAEIESYCREIASLLERVRDALQGLSEAQLNQQSPVEGGNSAYVIAVHTLGNARAWVLGIACGRPGGRDRPSEFRSSGSFADIEEATRRLCGEIEAALGDLPPAELDRRLVPPGELWGEGEPHEISKREALIHVVEHASIHLGHLQVTRDLLLRGATA